jgi:hypothetical protein
VGPPTAAAGTIRSRRRRRDLGNAPVSPFEPMLRGLEIPQVFTDMFLIPSEARYDVLLEGAMDQIWSVRWVKPLLRLLAKWDMLFPEDATDVPTTMLISIGRDRRGRLCHHWNRTFQLPHSTRRFNAHIVWEPSRGWTAERTGPFGCIEAAWRLKVVPPNVLEVMGSVKALHIGRFRLPIPRFLQLDALAVDTAHPERRDTLHCDLSMSSPVFGRLFGYHGTFRVRRVPVLKPRELLTSA